MSKLSVFDWDTTAANNIDLGVALNTSGSGLISTADDSLREIMAQEGRAYKDLAGVNQTVAGTANAITLTINQPWAALADGQIIAFKNTVGPNTGATTITVTNNAAVSLTLKKIRAQGDTALTGGEMLLNGVYQLRYVAAYDGAAGAFALLNPSRSSSIAAGLNTGFLFGLTLSNNVADAVNDIDIASGSARNSTDIDNLVLASAITKRLDAAWVVGTNQGGLDTGTIADTTYHVFLIKRVDTGVVDVLYSLSATAPTMPTSYTLFRRVGSIMRVAGTMVPFLQKGDVFYRGTPTRDTSAVNPGTAAVTRTVSVPIGIIVTALLQGGGNGGSNAWTGILSSLEVADATPTGTAFNIFVPAPTTVSQVFTRVDVSTDTSAQIRTRISPSGALDVLQIITLGWIDIRGRT